MEEAFARTDADFCILVVQPFLRWRAVNLAVAHGLPIGADVAEVLAGALAANAGHAVVHVAEPGQPGGDGRIDGDDIAVGFWDPGKGHEVNPL